MARIMDIEGIGPVYAKKLTEAGIKITDDLLKLGATAKMREELEKKTGIAHKLILEWLNLADFYRIKGVGSEYSDLLRARNGVKKLVRRPPPLSAVKDWVEQAKKLKRIVEY